MKAAKAPPAPQLVGEALVAADIVLAWKEGRTKTIDARVHHDRACALLEQLDDAGTTTCTCAAASDAELVVRTVNAAMAEYLRQNPRARSSGVPYQWFPNGERNAKGRAEFDCICMFCRASLNTVAGRTNMPRAFWEPIEKHTWHCAALFLGGLLKASHPSTEHRDVPVAKLKGKRLLRHATEAALYMEVIPPKGGRYGTRTGAAAMRAMVVHARKVRAVLAKNHQDPAAQALLNDARLRWGPMIRVRTEES